MSQRSGRSQGIVRLASSPQSPSSPTSSPANTIGTPGVVICSPIPTTRRSREPAMVLKRGVSWLSSSGQECITEGQGRPALKARIAATACVPSILRSPAGMPQNVRRSSSGRSSPRSHDQTGRRKPE